jgi:hypothetical protein
MSSAVSEARHPSLSSFLPARKPRMATSEGSWPMPRSRTFSRSDVGFVMMKELIPFVPFEGSVTAVTTKISPTLP